MQAAARGAAAARSWHSVRPRPLRARRMRTRPVNNGNWPGACRRLHLTGLALRERGPQLGFVQRLSLVELPIQPYRRRYADRLSGLRGAGAG
eukprot:359660-Chlamydomonas_euryale.AAC.8